MSVKLGVPEVNVFSSGDKTTLDFEHTSLPSFECLARSFFQLADTRLSDTQKTVLVSSARLLRFHDLTLTALADRVSRSSSVAYSTVKWNLRALADMGLVMGGNKDNRGQSAVLTDSARLLVSYFEKNGLA